MRYLSVFITNHVKPIAVIDLVKPDRIDVIDAIYYCDVHGGNGYVSNYKNILNAEFERRADTGEIKESDLPQRLAGDELIDRLEALLRRGKDKQPRKMHPKSLANLQPCQPFTSAERPCKRRKLTDDQIEEAIKLRASGCPWRMLGDRYGVSHDTVRLTLRNRAS